MPAPFGQPLTGDCGLCSRPVEGEENGCVALDQVYHNSCFKCTKCSEYNELPDSIRICRGVGCSASGLV